MKLSAFVQTLCVFRRTDGASLVETALITPTLVLFLLAAFDFGQGYFQANEVESAAHAGAEYGIQNPDDTDGIQAAAKADAPDVKNLTTPTVSYGCECSDGTSSSTNCSTTPSCTTNVVYWVSVTTSATYSPTIHGLGVPSTIALSSTAVMRSSQP
jgi:Flp pilus assembly protein TadG